jgi:hypothetical protein
VTENSILLSALKIHVSPKTKEALDHFKTFILELRGEVEMKVSRNGEKEKLRRLNYLLRKFYLSEPSCFLV